MCVIRHLTFSTSSVRSGTIWLETREISSEIPENILRPIRNLYIALHQGTNSAPTRFSSATGDDDNILWVPDTYPVCNVSSHIHNDPASTASAPVVPHDDPAPSPASLVTPIAPSFPLPEPFHIDENLMTVPPHDNSYPTRHAIESLRFPVTPPDPASSGAMRDPAFNKQESAEQKRAIVTPMPQPAPEVSAISYPPSIPVPPIAVLQPSVIPLTPPVPQTLPTPASSAPALDNILLTGPSHSLR